MHEKICRWGILSTAAIAKKNWDSIRRSGCGQVVAVASRSVEKAEAFIASCQASAPTTNAVDAVGSYDELLDRSDIDAVYIPLPTGLRTDWVVKAAEAGKHVMVEKPCGVSADDVRRMIAACDANNVQFMDGVMFMHNKRMGEMRRILDDGSSVGTIRRITSQFSFCAPEDWVQSNIRAGSELEPAGCLGDLGWYTIRFILFAMNYQMPSEVRGRILNSVCRDGSGQSVPMEFQGELHFEGGASASFYNSFRTNHQQLGHISGDKGYLQVNDFVLPFLGNTSSFEVANHNFVEEGCRFTMEQHSRQVGVAEYSNNAADAQETQLFRKFSELVLSGQRDPFWPEVSLKTQLVLDAALRSANHQGRAETVPMVDA